MTVCADIVFLSHLRWNFVCQRPQHLVQRARATSRCFFVEEPVFHEGAPTTTITDVDGITLVVPHLPHGSSDAEAVLHQTSMLDQLFGDHGIVQPTLYYWTPMALPFTRHLPRSVTVYDCMDELTSFKNAPSALRALERELMRRADIVFTGGQSLFEAKRAEHPNIHPMPSSVDAAHFRRARERCLDPLDQRDIPRPRVGFYGVIDERMDLALVERLADLRPDIHLVMLGPVVKIDPEGLPQRPNIHWLGSKRYDELPTYLAGWDVAMMPFARNASTLYISPTKTPEYLAGGKPVVSTSIRDVVRPYRDLGLARIADDPLGFARAIDEAIAEDPRDRHVRADAMLERTSWDRTWARMQRMIVACMEGSTSQSSIDVASLRAGAR